MRTFLFLFLALLGCSKPSEIILPEMVGEWKQVSQETLAPTEDEAIVRSYRYEGSVPVSVTTYQFKSNTVTFEKFQQWQVKPDTLPFYKGSLLVVPAGENREVLQKFSDALQPMLR